MRRALRRRYGRTHGQLTVTSDVLPLGAARKIQERITITNGHRLALVFKAPGEKAHAVGFNGSTTEAPVSRIFQGRMWITREGAIKAATRWVEET